MLLDDVNARFSQLKPDEKLIDKLLEIEQSKNQKKFVVLDDDPTGIQTVHDVFVYTDWSVESIKHGLLDNNSMFYLLTNSRAMTDNQTTKIHLELTNNVINAALETGKGFMIISRSDSTLRGHYPMETELVKQVVESKSRIVIDGEIIFPFFKEGGRYTIDDIHYVDEGGTLIPVSDTEFARDKTFGYQSSNLCDYIEEKTNGDYMAEDTISISLESLRRMELDKITSLLCSAGDFTKIIVNAIDYIDVKVFCIALFRTMASGRNFMFRSAASFVKVLGGISDQPLLTRKEMIKENHSTGGIIVVGSYTKKTTRQLDQLKSLVNIQLIEFNPENSVEPEAYEREIIRVVEESEACIRKGITIVIYTNRTLQNITGESKEDTLLRSVRLSEAVCQIVGRLAVTPSFVLAKGGNTSSDIGVKALRVKRARVLGQVRPGIPVWETDRNSKFPDIPFIIFPGNVGNDMTLREVTEILLKDNG
jgi:uncharacterized protein YgbK (DUF1537 family)